MSQKRRCGLSAPAWQEHKGNSKVFPILYLMCVLTYACATVPSNNVDFATIESVYDLEGSYRNQGEQKAGEYLPVMLSAVIWPKESTLKHKEIKLIKVRALDSTSIVVSAISENKIEKEETFIEGKHFTLTKGRIRLRHGFGLHGATAEDPLAGPYYGSVELGIDQKGQGKLMTKEVTVGLIYFIIPIGYAGSDEIRFRRVEP